MIDVVVPSWLLLFRYRGFKNNLVARPILQVGGRVANVVTTGEHRVAVIVDDEGRRVAAAGKLVREELGEFEGRECGWGCHYFSACLSLTPFVTSAGLDGKKRDLRRTR